MALMHDIEINVKNNLIQEQRKMIESLKRENSILKDMIDLLEKKEKLLFETIEKLSTSYRTEN